MADEIEQRIDNIRLAHVRMETMLSHLSDHLVDAIANIRLLNLELARKLKNAKTK